MSQHSFPALTTEIASECEQMGMGPLQKHLFDLKGNNCIFTIKQYLSQIQLFVADHSDQFLISVRTFTMDQNSHITLSQTKSFVSSQHNSI